MLPAIHMVVGDHLGVSAAYRTDSHVGRLIASACRQQLCPAPCPPLAAGPNCLPHLLRHMEGGASRRLRRLAPQSPLPAALLLLALALLAGPAAGGWTSCPLEGGCLPPCSPLLPATRELARCMHALPPRLPSCSPAPPPPPHSRAGAKRSQSSWACGPRSRGELCRDRTACCARWVRCRATAWQTQSAHRCATAAGCMAPQGASTFKAAMACMPHLPAGHLRDRQQVLRSVLHQRQVLACAHTQPKTHCQARHQARHQAHHQAQHQAPIVAPALPLTVTLPPARALPLASAQVAAARRGCSSPGASCTLTCPCPATLSHFQPSNDPAGRLPLAAVANKPLCSALHCLQAPILSGCRMRAWPLPHVRPAAPSLQWATPPMEPLRWAAMPPAVTRECRRELGREGSMSTAAARYQLTFSAWQRAHSLIDQPALLHAPRPSLFNLPPGLQHCGGGLPGPICLRGEGFHRRV